MSSSRSAISSCRLATAFSASDAASRSASASSAVVAFPETRFAGGGWPSVAGEGAESRPVGDVAGVVCPCGGGGGGIAGEGRADGDAEQMGQKRRTKGYVRRRPCRRSRTAHARTHIPPALVLSCPRVRARLIIEERTDPPPRHPGRALRRKHPNEPRHRPRRKGREERIAVARVTVEHRARCPLGALQGGLHDVARGTVRGLVNGELHASEAGGGAEVEGYPGRRVPSRVPDAVAVVEDLRGGGAMGAPLGRCGCVTGAGEEAR